MNNLNNQVQENFKTEFNKIREKYLISNGYTLNTKGWVKNNRKVRKDFIIKDNNYSNNFKKFWNKEFINGDTLVYHDKDKVYNPETKRFVKKSNFITQKGKAKKEGIEIYNSKVVRPDNFIQENIVPKLQNSLETGNKQEITIPKGSIGNIQNLLDVLPFGEKKMYFILGDGSYYFLNTENIKRIAQMEKQLTTGFQEVVSVKENTDSDMEYISDIIYFEKDLELVIENFVGNQVIGGEYFPYTHNLPLLDLSRQHIYNELTIENAQELHNKNCLLHALEVAGYNITNAKQFVTNQNVPLRQLKTIAQLLGICISVRRIEDNKNLRKFGDPDLPIVQLGLIENHYFLIEKVNYTGFSIKNYFDIDKEKYSNDWNTIIKKNNQKDKKRFLTSYDIIKILLECKETHLTKCNISNPIFHTKQYEKINVYDDLEFNNTLYHHKDNPEGNFKSNKLRMLPSENEDFEIKQVVWFDFETSTGRNDQVATTHKPYVVHTDYNRQGWKGKDCGKQFLDDICDKYGELTSDKESQKKVYCKNVVVKLIAHNSGYDFRFIQEYLHNLETLEKGNGLFTATGVYYGKNEEKGSYVWTGKYKSNNQKIYKYQSPPGQKLVRVEIIDSLKMINMGLGKFNKCFDLGKVKKEIMPYDLYTEENVELELLPFDYCIDYVKFVDKTEYKENCIKWDCLKIVNGVEMVDIIKYSSEYCYMDCVTLKQGYLKFRQMCLDACKLDIYDFVSLASLSDFYLKKEGCYDGVNQLSGVVRAFIQECVVGGRTMTRKNQKYMSVADKQQYMKLKNNPDFTPKQRDHIVNKKLADFDGVSLYPSAMNRMLGFLMGLPKIIKTFEPEKYDGYFIKIKVTKVKKSYEFPLVSFKDENGIRQFTNDVVGKHIFVDKTYLEDLVEFQGIEYEFLQGYYFDEGRNDKIKETIKYLFEQRLYYKELKNPIQMIFKELMNSSYGKSYLKPIVTDTTYLKEKEKDTFVDRNYNYIKEFIELPNGQYKVKTIKTINNHFNNAH